MTLQKKIEIQECLKEVLKIIQSNNKLIKTLAKLIIDLEKDIKQEEIKASNEDIL